MRAHPRHSCSGLRHAPLVAAAILAWLAPTDHACAQWAWVQSHGALRTGVTLTSVAADPRDGRHILLGTDEGSVVETTDGGVIWLEHPVTERLIAARSMGTPWATSAPEADPPGPEYADVASLLPFTPELDVDPWPAVGPREGAITNLTNPFSLYALRVITYLPGDYFSPPLLVRQGRASRFPATLLSLANRTRTTDPVRQIAVCPDGPWTTLVATRTALYGAASADTGFVRLYGAPRLTISSVRCTGLVVALSTSDGLLISRDGGTRFDITPFGDPGTVASAVTVDEQGRVAVALDEEIWMVDASGRVMSPLPAASDGDAAPWVDIHSLAVGPGRTLWIGTEDGLRVSRDGGASYAAVERAIFLQQRVISVAARGARVAAVLETCNGDVCRGTQVVGSDDAGAHWAPSFDAYTRRRIREVVIAADGRVWVIAGGEAWVSAPPAGAGVDTATRRWASRRLRSDAPLGETIMSTLRRARLDGEGIESTMEGIHGRWWIPRLELYLWGHVLDASWQSQGVSGRPTQLGGRGDELLFTAYALLTFDWPDAGFSYWDETTRATLYRLGLARREI